MGSWFAFGRASLAIKADPELGTVPGETSTMTSSSVYQPRWLPQTEVSKIKEVLNEHYKNIGFRIPPQK